MLFTCGVYIHKSVLKKKELKIESWGKQHCDFHLEVILGKVAISTVKSRETLRSQINKELI